MNFKISILFLLIFTLLGSSCSQTLKDTTPAATLEIINLQITPELEHWMPRISRCAETIEGIGIYTQILTQEEVNINQTDLVMRLGQRRETDPYAAVLGFEEIVLLIGNAVPVNTLSKESVSAIFAGEFTHWEDVPEVNQGQITIHQPIPTLSYPEGNILHQLFSKSYLENESIQSDPLIFSTPEGFDQLIQTNPYGIGYLLAGHNSGNQSKLDVTGFDGSSAQVYVLAITETEPEGRLKELLLCLQESQ